MDYWRQPINKRNACWQCDKRYPACQDHCPERQKEIEANNLIKETRQAYIKLRADIIVHSRYTHRRIANGR